MLFRSSCRLLVEYLVATVAARKRPPRLIGILSVATVLPYDSLGVGGSVLAGRRDMYMAHEHVPERVTYFFKVYIEARAGVDLRRLLRLRGACGLLRGGWGREKGAAVGSVS